MFVICLFLLLIVGFIAVFLIEIGVFNKRNQNVCSFFVVQVLREKIEKGLLFKLNPFFEKFA